MRNHVCDEHCGHTIVVEGPRPLDPLQLSYARDLDRAVGNLRRDPSPENEARRLVSAIQFARVMRRG